jgi:hypothetical protein
MTEAKWLVSNDPKGMLAWFCSQRILSLRKSRLFAVACCRRAWDRLTDERSRRAVEAAERFADGRTTKDELITANQRASLLTRPGFYDPAFGAYAASHPDWSSDVIAGHAAYGTYAVRGSIPIGIERRSKEVRQVQKAARMEEEKGRAEEAILLRDILGNPFRAAPVTDPVWLIPMSFNLRTKFTSNAPSSGCPNWQLPSKKLVATTARLLPTVA